jgi:tetraacyldisaccharide 4'-kinase
MILLRKLLFPFALLYGLITSIRNYLYDKGILKSYSFDVPVIVVGNLSVGGTGKTPQIEYLIRLLSSKYSIATLSRGYKRKSKGFVLANAHASASLLGDEPYQYYKKFPQIQVAVDADRRNGITQLLQLTSKPEVLLLDDAYQHRRVKAGFYILLTSYDELYAHDYMLPTGNLRESRSGAKRANMIIVTKCPPTISEIARAKIKSVLQSEVPVFFSSIEYDDTVYSATSSLPLNELNKQPKLLVAGIAKPKPFFDFLQQVDDRCISFPDHHEFSSNDIERLKAESEGQLIVTTEKDFVRLNTAELADKLYYLPIKSKLITESATFDQIILDYVGTCSRNC